MDISQQKEQFSNAYLRAVTAVAGYTLYKPEVDDDSIDWGICARRTNTIPFAPRMEIQLKCTAREVLNEDHLNFALSIKNYNDLRARTLVPRLLIVVCVPASVENWITQSEEEMILRHCAYWLSLSSFSDPANSQTTQVRIPRIQRFTPTALQHMMQRINDGEIP